MPEVSGVVLVQSRLRSGGSRLGANHGFGQRGSFFSFASPVIMILPSIWVPLSHLALGFSIFLFKLACMLGSYQGSWWSEFRLSLAGSLSSPSGSSLREFCPPRGASAGLQHRLVTTAHMLNLIAGRERGFRDSVISTEKLG
jgi:hypothetical protein